MHNIFMILVSVFLSPPTSFATPGYQDEFINFYPANRGTPLENCATCHFPVVKDFLNNYGLALKQTGTTDFASAEAPDSDGDGMSNGEEIKAKRFPGTQSIEPELFDFENPRGTVYFNHKGHSVGASYGPKGNCNVCHGGTTPVFPKYFDKNVSVRDIAHNFCWKCHRDSGNANAPLKCSGCHN